MKNQDIKRKIIDHTRELMQKKIHITIKDIAEACYINIAAVNYHFGSKENLLLTVMDEVVEELKSDVIKLINENDMDIEPFLEKIVTYVYNFAIENIGVLNYLFLTNELQSETSNALVKTFFTENAFTRMVYKNLASSIKTENPKELAARYMIIFSSFSIPLFIQISEINNKDHSPLETFKDPEFRKFYIKQLVRMVENT
ncbi:MAG: TetR/AcrR family transcriptional regulator [Acholeplasmataceae bacterium]|nr:TetR/AcrR family transcriptional regulator [Acholeplasmataceae bacterium]